MSSYLTSQQFFRLGAVVLVTLVVAIAALRNRPSESAAVLTPLEPGEADALVRELARCRTIAPDDSLVLEACRRTWAENRRQFFAPTRPQQLPVPLVPDAPAGMKNQERVPRQEVDQKETR